jgi:DNA polymerase IV
MAVLRSFRPSAGAVVEVMGGDEAFVGVTTDGPERLARRIQEAVYTQTWLSCSVGVGDNLLRAKIATEFAKPPCAMTAGRASERASSGSRAELGCGDGRPVDTSAVGHRPPTLHASWPNAVCTPCASWPQQTRPRSRPTSGQALGPWYVQPQRGRGPVEVRGEPWLPRSRSHEETVAADLTEWAAVRAATAGLARRIAVDVTAACRPASRVGVRVRFAPFTTRSHSTTPAEDLARPRAVDDDRDPAAADPRRRDQRV